MHCMSPITSGVHDQQRENFGEAQRQQSESEVLSMYSQADLDLMNCYYKNEVVDADTAPVDLRIFTQVIYIII